MKALFLECNMGAAGDMLLAALLELHSDPALFLEKLNAAGVPGAHVTASPSEKCGIVGTHVSVTVNGEEESSEDVREHPHDHEHSHTHAHDHGHGHIHDHHHGEMRDIAHLISHLNVSDKVKRDALSVYNLLAEAESHAHGVPAADIHFHEVGTMDAVADIVGVCMLMEELDPERVFASPVHVGFGQVRCAHGILPVPAPATAYILRDIPIYGGDVRGELCTPTGAALLKHFAHGFGPMPVMRVSQVGYGMGKKNFERANCVRGFLGETSRNADDVAELTCNLDDMTPEAVAFAQQRLFEHGALDVYTTPIGMKKGRAGVMLTCMCKSEIKDEMIALLFKHTTTLGMRENISKRYTLRREQRVVQTRFGPVSVKTASGYGIEKTKPEYEDVAKIARENNLSLADILKEIK